jgi:hypothetical protein
MERKAARPGRLIEQQNLLGGVDLVPVAPRRGPSRPLHVDPRWKIGFAAALALVVEHGKRAQARAEMPPRTRCPRCQRTGDTFRDFGIRSVRGQRIPQSWCRSCRSATGGRRAPSQPDLLGSTAA